MPANLNTLPEGVIDEILDIVRRYDSYTCRRTVYSLCLVSQSLLHAARRELYRNVTLEHASGRPIVERFRRTITSDANIADFVRSLTISTALGGSARNEASQLLGYLLKGILESCTRLEEIRYNPDENARNFESTYVKAWSASSSLKRFTLVMAQFREIALTPRQPLQSLSLELARNGDWTWEYDYYTKSWPNRPPLQVDELHLVKLNFPAYNDQILVAKLEQITRAIACPQKLYLVSCMFSHKAMGVLLGLSPNGWKTDKLQEIHSMACYIVNGKDKATTAFVMPFLPGLTRLKVMKQSAKLILDPENKEVVLG